MKRTLVAASAVMMASVVPGAQSSDELRDAPSYSIESLRDTVQTMPLSRASAGREAGVLDQSAQFESERVVSDICHIYDCPPQGLKRRARLDSGRALGLLYRLLAETETDSPGATVFLDGMSAREQGRYVTAWQRFDFVSRLGVGPAWLLEAARSYRGKCAREADRILATMPEELERPYRKGFLAFQRGRWADAADYWEAYLAKARAFPSAPGDIFAAIPEAAELAEVSARLRPLFLLDRLRAESGGILVSNWCAEQLERIGGKGPAVIEDLEPLLYFEADLSRAQKERLRKSLFAAYRAVEIRRQTELMRRSYKIDDLNRCLEFAGRILRLDSGNEEAIRMVRRVAREAEARALP